MTETELVLMSMTNEELDDAVRWLEVVHRQWEESRAAIQARYGDDPPRESVLVATDGPMHLIRAMDLAILRERAQRGGADAWEAGMPIDDHPARSFLRYYQERISLNPDEGHKPRLSAAGVLEKVCVGCRESKPLTVAFWSYIGPSLDDWCKPCRAGKGPTAVTPVFLDVAPDPEPVAPFTAAEVAEVHDDSLALL